MIDSTDPRFLECSQVHRDQQQHGGCQGLGEEGPGSQCLMGMEFQLGKV